MNLTYEESPREDSSPAESESGRNIKEVHPGADLVKFMNFWNLAEYDSHSLRASSEDILSLLEWNRG